MIVIILTLSTSFFGQRRDRQAPDVCTEIQRIPGSPVAKDNNKPPAPIITEKDYKQIKSDASELAILSRKVSDQVNADDKFVVSSETQKDLERVEKLAKKLRSDLIVLGTDTEF
jgi:hypothetical protein